ncbi:signal peptide peptidase SppA [Pedobacter sp.]|uniref:signal peptide peptidase SppA n=1 Tax=Pedobacter sp. TaxID=1411316 RepID=UPI003D7F44C5
MREFFKYVSATVVGFMLSIFLVFIFFMFIIGAVLSSISDDKTVDVKPNSVLYLNLDQNIRERTPNTRFENLPIIGSSEKSIGLRDMIRAIEKAKTDPNIKVIYLNVSSPSVGKASLKEIRDAIIDFKKSKKQVIAYSEVYTQDAYYVASAANKVYLYPQGALEFKGFNSELMFFKGALEKMGIEAQIIRVGDYKSAVEPFINDKMSEYNRLQVSAYVNGLYKTFLQGISETRKIPIDSLFVIANDYKIQLPKDAITFKMVDALRYKDQVIDELKKLSGIGKNDKIVAVTINEYAENVISEKTSDRSKIAVIYAIGEITDGEGNDETIGSERISRAIRKARQDSNVKAIVLRVNSGGGSALASDVIWREMELSKKVKPVMASFGDVAASGGYYIACSADSIFVQPNTITGSIGVFGIIPNFQKLLNTKLGITFDGVKTGKYADIMSVDRPLTAGERFIIQNEVNHIYDVFVTRVADGRKMTTKYVDSIGGGRVWVGTDAVRLGLADRLGSFQDAIAAAGKKAKLKTYRVVEYPEKTDPFKSLMDSSTDKIRTYYAQKEFGEHFLMYEQMKKAVLNSGIQARMPFNININ